jgi:hypothetical protein
VRKLASCLRSFSVVIDPSQAKPSQAKQFLRVYDGLLRGKLKLMRGIVAEKKTIRSKVILLLFAAQRPSALGASTPRFNICPLKPGKALRFTPKLVELVILVALRARLAKERSLDYLT